MLILKEKAVKKLIPATAMGSVINSVERGFRDYAKGRIQMPPKEYLYFPEYQGDLRIMPAYSSVLKMAGTKIVNVHPNNKNRGLPTVMAQMILNDARNGKALAIMDAAWLTGMRTGAAGAVAVKYLARKNAHTLGVIGAGQQAFFQILAITRVRKIKEIAVYDIAANNVAKLANGLRPYIKIPIKRTGVQGAAQKDILVTTTPLRKPIIKNEWVKLGAHINAIGADAPGKEELDPTILKRAKIVVDDFKQASHSGEINVPLSRGIVDKTKIFAELGEIITGEKPGRKREQEITLFDSTGLAFQDLYTAHLVLSRSYFPFVK